MRRSAALVSVSCSSNKSGLLSSLKGTSALPPTFALTQAAGARVHTEAKIKELGLDLPPVAKPAANYVPSVRTGNLVYIAGQIPYGKDGRLVHQGKVGKEVTQEQAYEAAKACALCLVSALKQEVGDLDKVKRIVKVHGLVNCVDGFDKQPAVINGVSDTMVAIFGKQRGSHARMAVGTNALPLNVPVEVDMIAEVE
ncbi:Endoribonuclease L-PSP [Balamuthia mandrillaris]